MKEKDERAKAERMIKRKERGTERDRNRSKWGNYGRERGKKKKDMQREGREKTRQ